MIKLSHLLSALAVSLTATSTSAALLDIHESELLQSCHSLKQNVAAPAAASCATYINGFLDGALLTDAQNALELNHVAQSSFMERALRTRLGGRDTPESFLHFCVPSSMQKADVIENISPYLTDTQLTNVDQLRGVIFTGLKKQFPC